MRTKNIVLLLIISILFIKVNATNNTSEKIEGKITNKISGKITDSNNQPLPGATVYIISLDKGTVTDKNGNYTLKNLPNGKFKIQVSFIGYKTQIRTINIRKNDVVLNLKLTPEVIQTQEIVISGAYLNTQHENSVKIATMNSKSITLSGFPNVMEALTKVPGVDMISKGTGVTKPVIRGLSMQNILVLNNGFRIENYQFGDEHPLGIDMNGIEKVEIVKGPASLLYGSDAIGGVLNFIKEKSAPTNEILGDYHVQLFSNTLGINNSIGVKGASDKLFGGIRLSKKSHSDYLQGGGQYVPNTRFNEFTLNANTGYMGKIGTFKLNYDYFKQNLGMAIEPSVDLITKRDRKNEVWYQDLTHQMISSQNNLYFGAYKLSINASYQDALRKLQTTLNEPFIEMDLKTITYESKLYLPTSSKMDAIIGVQGMNKENKNLNDRPSKFLPDAKIGNIGLLSLFQYKFANQIKLQTGLRYDLYKTQTNALGNSSDLYYHAPINKQFSNVNGSIGATWMPTKKILFRVNLAKAYRVPNLFELTANGIHDGKIEKGNAGLNPQNSYEADISTHFHNEWSVIDLAGFYNDIENYIFSAPTNQTSAEGFTIYQVTQANAKLYGGEAGIHIHPQSLPWLHFKTTYSMVIGQQEDGHYLPFIPAHKLHYEIGFKGKKLGFLHRSEFKISALSAFAQKNPAPEEDETSAYTLINLSLSSNFNIAKQSIEFSFLANNLFDVKYFDHLSTLRELGYYNPGRNISFSLKIPFTIKQ